MRSFTHVVACTKKYVEVEGMTTYETLVDETLNHGVMPTVVPELKSITVGGAVAGIGIESSSIKYGLVHEGVIEMEIVLPSGKIITVSRKKNKDLFYAFPNSYGTLGYAIKLKLSVIPVKQYVELVHKRFLEGESFFDEIGQLILSKVDFVLTATLLPQLSIRMSSTTITIYVTVIVRNDDIMFSRISKIFCLTPSGKRATLKPIKSNMSDMGLLVL